MEYGHNNSNQGDGSDTYLHAQNEKKISPYYAEKPCSKRVTNNLTQEVKIVEEISLNFLFFPFLLEEWFHLDLSMKNLVPIIAFKQKL